MMFARANDPPNVYLGYFSTRVKPTFNRTEGEYEMHQLPGHCPDRPRPAGTYEY